MSKNQTKSLFQHNYNKSSHSSNGTWVNYKELNANLQQENSKLKLEYDHLNKLYVDLSGRFTNLFKENQALLSEIQQLNLSLNTKLNEFTTIGEENKNLLKANAELSIENKRLREEIEAISQKNIMNNSQELDNLRATNTTYIDYLYSKDCIIGNLTGMVSHLQCIIKDRDEKLQQVISNPELMELKKSHEELQKKYNEMQQELGVAQRCLELYFVGDKRACPF